MAEENEGLFLKVLKRNNKQIREDRAKDLFEDAQMFYKREVDDIEMMLRKKKNTREALLDLSPENSTNLKMSSNFDAKNFCSTDLDLGVEIRNLEIRLDLAKRRYEELFGKGEE